MKYFAKYRPVKGDIKEGDFYHVVGSNEYFQSGLGENTSVKKYPHDRWDKLLQKVKLFLCSRDIEVGDMFIYVPPDGEGKELTQIATENTIEALKTITFPYWKVIGEISPEARWVKEGDEFNEDEVTEPMFNDVGSHKAYCFIKGPCGHFH